MNYDVKIISRKELLIIGCADEREATKVFCEALERPDKPLRVTIRKWENGECVELDNCYVAWPP